jgi:hypothetical protein
LVDYALPGFDSGLLLAVIGLTDFLSIKFLRGYVGGVEIGLER